MLHLRMIVPSDRTEEVATLVSATLGATHLTVVRGAAYDPLGDVLTCDVARESADGLLSGLRELGVADTGSIAVENIDVSMSRSAEQARQEAPGEGADAVVWEKLVEETHEESTLTVTYLAFLTVATMLAAYGVMLDSSILIVGAMVVGPEFGPLAGVCTGLVRHDRGLLGRSVVALAVGFPVAMLLAGVFSDVMDSLGLFTQARFDAPHPATQFIWQPSWDSFVVAFLAGIAGILSLTSSKSGALVGVAISVTTVPAAANAALAFSYGQWHEVWGSVLQLVINLGGIALAGTLTLLAQKRLWARQRRLTV